MKFINSEIIRKENQKFVKIGLLGNILNIFLVDSFNFQNYKSDIKNNFYWCLEKRLPIRLQIPGYSYKFTIKK